MFRRKGRLAKRGAQLILVNSKGEVYEVSDEVVEVWVRCHRKDLERLVKELREELNIYDDIWISEVLEWLKDKDLVE